MDSEEKLDGVPYASQGKWVKRKLAYKSEDPIGADCENNGSNLGRVKAGVHVFLGSFQSLSVFKEQTKGH